MKTISLVLGALLLASCGGGEARRPGPTPIPESAPTPETRTTPFCPTEEAERKLDSFANPWLESSYPGVTWQHENFGDLPFYSSMISGQESIQKLRRGGWEFFFVYRQATQKSADMPREVVFTTKMQFPECKPSNAEALPLVPLEHMKPSPDLKVSTPERLQQAIAQELEGIQTLWVYFAKSTFKVHHVQTTFLPQLRVAEDGKKYSQAFVSFQSEVTALPPDHDVSKYRRSFFMAVVLIDTVTCENSGSLLYFFTKDHGFFP